MDEYPEYYCVTYQVASESEIQLDTWVVNTYSKKDWNPTNHIGKVAMKVSYTSSDKQWFTLGCIAPDGSFKRGHNSDDYALIHHSLQWKRYKQIAIPSIVTYHFSPRWGESQ